MVRSDWRHESLGQNYAEPERDGRSALHPRDAGHGGNAGGLVATGHAHAEILKLYPYLETEDINQALKYAAWRAEEFELPLQPA